MFKNKKSPSGHCCPKTVGQQWPEGDFLCLVINNLGAKRPEVIKVREAAFTLLGGFAIETIALCGYHHARIRCFDTAGICGWPGFAIDRTGATEQAIVMRWDGGQQAVPRVWLTH